MTPYIPQPWTPQKLEERRRLARLAPYEPLLVSAAAVMGGVVLDRCASLGGWWLVGCFLSWLVWLLLWRVGKDCLSAVALLVGVALLAAAWHHVGWRQFSQEDLGLFTQVTSQPICVEAVALQSPGIRAAPESTPFRAIPAGQSSRLEVRLVRLRDGTSWRAASGLCQLSIDGHLLGVRAGDRLRLYGQLSRPSPAMNPSEFDQALDQRAQRRLSRLRCESPDCVTVVAPGSAWSPSRWIDGAQSWGESVLLDRLGPKHGALSAAMIVGSQDRLPRSTVERYRRSGTLHVLVVSGLHVGLVISAFYFVARMGWTPRRSSLVVVMLAIAAYALLTGARPPVVRAAVLAELMCLALWQGRTVLAMNSLGAAAIVVLAMNPCELFRTGAQLSFLAAATLIWFGRRQLDWRANLDPMTRLLRSVESPPRRALRATGSYAWLIFVATVAVWIVAAPLMMYRYHLLSPLAMPLAVAVFPLVGASVITGLFVLAAQFVFPPLAPLAATISGHACEGLERSVHLADASYFYVPGPALWWVLAAYALLAIGLRWGARPAVRKGLTYAMPLMILAAFGPSLATGLGMTKEAPRLRGTFLSVGHGVSVLIESPDGGVVLYDAGSLASPSLATEKISAVLWSKGITRIDAVMLSHADIDHFNGLPGLLERFEVGAVYTSPQTLPRTLLPDERTAPAELSRLLSAHGVAVQTLTLGDRLRLGGATVEVLHPTALGVVDTDNANSLVVGIEYAGRRLLLPGDLEGRGLEQLLLQEAYECDVLLAPHHGSPRSDPLGLAAWCRPEWVVISSAPGVYSDAANLSYEEAGARVLSTAESGAVTFEIRAAGIEVQTYRE